MSPIELFWTAKKEKQIDGGKTEPDPFAQNDSIQNTKWKKIKFSLNGCKIQGGKTSIFDLRFIIF